MIGYLLFTVLFLSAGAQIGVFLSLVENKVKPSRAIIHSFIIYLLPLITVVAHVSAYKNKESLINEYIKVKDLDTVSSEQFRNKMSSLKFFVIIVYSAIIDLITPKDNILIAIEVSTAYEKNQRKVPVKEKVKQKEDIGIIGILFKYLKILLESMFEHVNKSKNKYESKNKYA